MPRMARMVFPGLPYHVTQRGGRRLDVLRPRKAGGPKENRP